MQSTTRPAAVWWSLLLCRWPGRLCWQGWGSVGWSCCRPCRCGNLGRTDTAPQSHSAASWPACGGGVTTKKHISHHSYRLERKTFREVFRWFSDWLRGDVKRDWSSCLLCRNNGAHFPNALCSFTVCQSWEVRLTRCSLGSQSVCRACPTCLHCL